MDMHREAAAYDRWTGESDPDAYPVWACEECGWENCQCRCFGCKKLLTECVCEVDQ